MSSKISFAYTVVAATVGHVVICFKGADYAVRGIEYMARRIEQRRAQARSKVVEPSVIEGEYTVVAK